MEAKLSVTRILRPSICPDKDCHVLVSSYNEGNFRYGYSFHCIGQLPEPCTIIWKQAGHTNNYSFCMYTGLKGLIRFLMCCSDFEGISSDMERVLDYESCRLC